MQRLDKLVAKSSNISRKDAKNLIKKGEVSVDGKIILNCDEKVSENAKLTVNGKSIEYSEFVYIMLNKPKGVVSASQGKEKTVIDILPNNLKRNGLFPAGRLDKNTTGFCLITNDGNFAHDILSPKKHVEKVYEAVLDKPFDETVIKDFENGMTLSGEKLLEAKLVPKPDFYNAEITIRQGLYHQIKRMFKKHGIEVLELKRTKIGGLWLDCSLKEGECKILGKEEIEKIKTRQ